MTALKELASGGHSPVIREQRSRKRYDFQGKVRIEWSEDGLQRQVTAQIRNLGGKGLACLMAQRFPTGTVVRVECAAEHLFGDAIVRHCTPKGINYIVGFEFRGALEWRGAEDAPRRKCWD